MKCIRCKAREEFKEGFCKKCYNDLERSLIDAEKTKIRMFGYPNANMNKKFTKQALKEIKEENDFLKRKVERDERI